MPTWTIEVSDELNALLQNEAARHDQTLDATVRGLLLAKMREVEAARVPLRARLKAAWQAFNNAKKRGENAARLAELDEEIDEVLDDIYCFEDSFQEPTKPEDCVPLDVVLKEMGYEREIPGGSAGGRSQADQKAAGKNSSPDVARSHRIGNAAASVRRKKAERPQKPLPRAS